MSQTNRKVAPEVDTIFFTTSLEYAYLSSSIVKEVAQYGGDISAFVAEPVEKAIKQKFAQKIIKVKKQMFDMTSDIKEKIKMSKIEQLIGEIEEFIDGCKLQPFSSTKIVVDKAQLEDLLVELVTAHLMRSKNIRRF